jgi:hypothetical protein
MSCSANQPQNLYFFIQSPILAIGLVHQSVCFTFRLNPRQHYPHVVVDFPLNTMKFRFLPGLAEFKEWSVFSTERSP